MKFKNQKKKLYESFHHMRCAVMITHRNGVFCIIDIQNFISLFELKKANLEEKINNKGYK